MSGVFPGQPIGNHSLTVLTITPRQAFEVSRLLDRTGDGVVAAHRDGMVVLLVDARGTGRPNMALELDRDGEVVATQVLAMTTTGPMISAISRSSLTRGTCGRRGLRLGAPAPSLVMTATG